LYNIQHPLLSDQSKYKLNVLKTAKIKERGSDIKSLIMQEKSI